MAADDCGQVSSRASYGLFPSPDHPRHPSLAKARSKRYIISRASPIFPPPELLEMQHDMAFRSSRACNSPMANGRANSVGQCSSSQHASSRCSSRTRPSRLPGRLKSSATWLRAQTQMMADGVSTSRGSPPSSVRPAITSSSASSG